MLCLRCRAPVRRVEHMSWWACACRIWATDEQIESRWA
jgi:hypothetical protein